MGRVINLDTAAGADNPSSIHAAGRRARQVLNGARLATAQALNAHADEIIFTSGGTEGNNLAIFGVAGQRTHIITSVIEHASILEPCRELERRGHPVTYLPVSREGLVSPTDLAKALRPNTRLVSIGYANNEIGVIQPIRELAKIIRHFKNLKPKSYNLEVGPYFHTDACQAPCFLDCRASTLGVDLMTLNSDKIYGPHGVGYLFVHRGVKLSPLFYGGGQERGWRSGTENVLGIAGFAAALTLGVKLRKKESDRLAKLRDYFLDRLLKLPGVTLNGSRTMRLPNNINVSFTDADSEFVVFNLDAHGVYASSGSACSTSEKPASHVVMSLGHDDADGRLDSTSSARQAETAVRFTLGRDIAKRDLNYVLKILPDILKRARAV